MEINFNHGDPLDMADQVFVFKRTVRETAQRHDVMHPPLWKAYAKSRGQRYTFIKYSLVRNWKNIFNSADNEPTPELMHYNRPPAIHARSHQFLCAKRQFVSATAPDISAPINLSWGMTIAQQPSEFLIAHLTTGVSRIDSQVLMQSIPCHRGVTGKWQHRRRINCSPPRLTKARPTMRMSRWHDREEAAADSTAMRNTRNG